MTSRLVILAARREALVARSVAHREEIRQSAVMIRRQISWAEGLVRVAQVVRRSGPIVAGVVGLLVGLGPTRLFGLLKTASRYAPIAVNAYRFVRRRD